MASKNTSYNSWSNRNTSNRSTGDNSSVGSFSALSKAQKRKLFGGIMDDYDQNEEAKAVANARTRYEEYGKQLEREDRARQLQGNIARKAANDEIVKGLRNKIDKGATLTPSETITYARDVVNNANKKFKGLDALSKEYLDAHNASQENDIVADYATIANSTGMNMGATRAWEAKKEADNKKAEIESQITKMMGDKANEYLTSIERLDSYSKDQKAREEYRIAEGDKKLGKFLGNEVASLAASYTPVFGNLASMEAEKGRINERTSEGFGSDVYSPYRGMINQANYATQANQETFNSKIGQTAYGMAHSAADSIIRTTPEMIAAGGLGLTGASSKVLQAGSLASFFQSSKENSYAEARERGYSEENAQLLGTISGTIEAVTEMLPNGKLLDNVAGKKIAKSAALNVLKGMHEEGTEEFISSIANDIADIIISARDEYGSSVFEDEIKEFKSLGYSDDEAFKKALYSRAKEYAMSYVEGAGSAAPMHMATTAYGVHTNKKTSESIVEENKEKLQSTEGDSEYARDTRAQAEIYANNPVRAMADQIDATTEEGKAAKEKALEIAEKEASGQKLNFFDRANLQNALTVAREAEVDSLKEDRDKLNARARYLQYTKELEQVPEEYRVAQTGTTAKEGTAMIQEAADKGDLKGISDSYNLMKNSTDEEARSYADEALEMIKGRNENITNEQIDGLKTTTQDAYLAGYNGVSRGEMGTISSVAAQAFNEGQQRMVEENATRNTITNANEIHSTEVDLHSGAKAKLGEFTENGILTEDGKTISAESIKVSTAIGKLYRAANAQPSVMAKNAFIDNIKDGDIVDNYKYAFDMFYQTGAGGQSFEKAIDSIDGQRAVAVFGEDRLKTIYEVGVDQKEDDLRAERAKATNKAFGTKIEGGVDARSRRLLQKRGYSNDAITTYDLISKLIGANVRFVENTNEGSKGSFNASKNEIIVDIHNTNAFFHEAFGEFMQEYNREGHDALRNDIMETANEIINKVQRGVTFEAYQKTYTELEGYQSVIKTQQEMTNDMFISILSTDAGRQALADKIYEKYGEEVGQKKINSIADFLNKAIYAIKTITDIGAKTRYMVEFEKHQDVLESYVPKLMEAWDKAIENKINAEIQNVGIAYDRATESVSPMDLTQFSLKSWTESEYVKEAEKATKALSKALKITELEARRYIDNINNIARIIADDKVRLDYDADPYSSAVVSNAEYGASIDFSTICKKRLLYTGTLQEIQKQVGNRVITMEDYLDIRNAMLEDGLQTTCGCCYVEGSRAKLGQYMKEFIKRYAADNPKYVPNMYDVTMPDGIRALRANHPEVWEARNYFLNHMGQVEGHEGEKNLFGSQGKPKDYTERTEYRGELLSMFEGKEEKVKEKNKNGGLRLQSFSDFEIVNLIDCMQVITDMARCGLAGQAYTKVYEFADALGNTGLKINLSLMAKGVDADGNLILDEVNGMKKDDAIALRNKYSKNVGTIIVAFTDEQIKAAMATDYIDYIIPFHRSQWRKTQYEVLGLPENTKDYTMHQNDRIIKENGRLKKAKNNIMPNEYWDFSKSGRENAQTYIDYCNNNRLAPKFAFLLEKKDGKYILPEGKEYDGYFKLLIDFKMYDNDGVGSPQMPVTPNFSMAEAEKMLKEYTGGHESFPVAKEIADKFAEKIVARGKEFVAKTESGDDIRHMSLSINDTVFVSEEGEEVNGTDLIREDEMSDLYRNLDHAPFLYKNSEGDSIIRADDDNKIIVTREDILKPHRIYIIKDDYYDRHITANAIIKAEELGKYEEAREIVRLLRKGSDFVRYDADFTKTNGNYVGTTVRRPTFYHSGLDPETQDRPTGFKTSRDPRDYLGKKEEDPYIDYGDMMYREDDEVFSLSVDDSGKELSEGQKEYFKDSKVVDEDGRLKVMYHGTKSAFTVFDPVNYGGVNGIAEGYGIYLTDNKNVSDAYGGNVIESYVNVTNPASKFEKTIKANKLSKLIEATCNAEVNALMEDGGYDNINDAIKDTWISNYVDTYSMPMNRAYTEVANQIIRQESNDMNIIQEIMTGMAIRDYKSAYEFYDILKDKMGIDGFITEWNDPENEGQVSQIVVAFDSNQIKNVTNENPTANEDIRYSLPVDDLLFDILENEESEQRVEAYKSTASILEEGMMALKNQEVDNKTIKRIASKLINEVGSKANVNTVSGQLEKVFAYLQSHDHVNYDNVMQILTEITTPIVDMSTEKVGVQAYRDFKNAFEGRKIALNNEQIAAVKEVFGSYAAFRDAMYPLTISKNGEALDSNYAEFVRATGYVMDADVSVADQPLALYDALQASRPSVVNAFGEDADQVARDMAMRVVEEYLKAQDMKEVKALAENVDKALKDYRDDIKYNYEWKLKNKDDQISELKVKNKNAAQKSRERKEVLQRRDQIGKNAKKLTDWISNPTEKHHVPKAMVMPLLNFMQSLDFVEPEIRWNKQSKTYYVDVITSMDEMPDGTRRPVKTRIESTNRSEVLRRYRAALGAEAVGNRANTWANRMERINDLLNKASRGESFGDSTMDNLMQHMDADLAEEFNNLIHEKADLKINALNAKDLTTIDNVLKQIIHAINLGDKACSMNARVTDWVESTIGESKKITTKDHTRFMNTLAKNVGVDMMTPETFFSLMGEKGQQIFEALNKGFETRVQDIKEASEYMQDVMKDVSKRKIRDWRGAKATLKTFNVYDGEIQLTVGQIMGLYELNKRAQARAHYVGGIKPDVIDRSIKGKIIQHSQDAVHVTDEDIERIISTLTDEQKEIADKMQSYMANQCAMKGNEASRMMYDFEKFLERDYYPITTDKTLHASTNSNNTYAAPLNGIERMGITKAVVPNADTPMVIRDIFEVFTDHVSDMAAYHGYAPAMKDANRWFNFKSREDIKNGFNRQESVKQAVNKCMGRTDNAGVAYYEKLMQDLSQAERSGDISTFMDQLVGSYKAAAIGANLRVVIQQPTAIIRALNELDAKYLLNSVPTLFSASKTIDKIKEVSPLVWWKTQGYYETSIGKSLDEIITGDTKLKDAIVEKSMWLAGKADDVTWSVLYTACEKEVKDQNPNLSDDELTEKINERFSNVVARTQVVDATLQKSQWMRAKGRKTNAMTAFMAEPTKSYNMAMKAMIMDNREYGNNIAKWDRTRKAMAVLALTETVNALAQAIIDGFRHSDDDDDYWETVIDYWKSNFMDSLNPLERIPVTKGLTEQVVKALKGESNYGSNSNQMLDMMAFSSILDALRTLSQQSQGSYKKTWYAATNTYLKALSNMTGVPFYGAFREISTAHNFFSDNDWVSKVETNKYADVYSAIMDDKPIEKIEDEIDKALENEGTLKDIQSGIQSKFKSNYQDMYEEDPESVGEIEELITKAYTAAGLSEQEIADKLDEWKDPSIGYGQLDKAIKGDGDVKDYAKEVGEAKGVDKATEHILNGYQSQIDYNREHGIDSDIEENVKEALKQMDVDYNEALEEWRTKEKAKESKALGTSKLNNIVDTGSGKYTDVVDEMVKAGVSTSEIKSYLTSAYKSQLVADKKAGKDVSARMNRIIAIKDYCDKLNPPKNKTDNSKDVKKWFDEK